MKEVIVAASDDCNGDCVQGLVLADLCALVNYAKRSSYRRQYVITIYTMSGKKVVTIFLAITLPNADRCSKFF